MKSTQYHFLLVTGTKSIRLSSSVLKGKYSKRLYVVDIQWAPKQRYRTEFSSDDKRRAYEKYKHWIMKCLGDFDAQLNVEEQFGESSSSEA